MFFHIQERGRRRHPSCKLNEEHVSPPHPPTPSQPIIKNIWMGRKSTCLYQHQTIEQSPKSNTDFVNLHRNYPWTGRQCYVDFFLNVALNLRSIKKSINSINSWHLLALQYSQCVNVSLRWNSTLIKREWSLLTNQGSHSNMNFLF